MKTEMSRRWGSIKSDQALDELIRRTREMQDALGVDDGTELDELIDTVKRTYVSVDKRDPLQKITYELARDLLKEAPCEEIVSEMLEQVGEFFGVDRTYVFTMDHDAGTMSNDYEWVAEGIEPQKDKLQNLKLESFPNWVQTVNNLQPVIIPDTSQMGEGWTPEKEILQAQDIKSLLVVPITKGMEAIGYIGFDSVRDKRSWTDAEINLLRTYGVGLGIKMSRETLNRQIKQRQ